MVRARLNSGCRESTPVRERPLHPTRRHLTPEASQTQAPVTLSHRWFDDFQEFANAVGAPVSNPNELSASVAAEGVSLRLAWVADRASQ